MRTVCQSVRPAFIGRCQDKASRFVVIKLERAVQLVTVVIVAPDDQISVGRYDCTVGDNIFVRFAQVVCKLHATGVIGLFGRIEKLYPVMLFERVVYEYVIGCTYLVYADRFKALLFAE